MNRNRLIIGLGILATLVLLTIAGIGLFRFMTRQPPISQKSRIVELGYCNASNLKPCIVSFDLDDKNQMFINILVPSSTYTDFYLTISRDNEEHRYTCQKVEDLPTRVYCVGVQMYPGQTLTFTMHAVEDGHILAQGRFAIIGLLLATPSLEATETAVTTETAQPTESPTPFVLGFPTPTPRTPTPSYPNPSYP